MSFTPHLMPIARGMQSTIYVRLAQGATAADLRSHLQVSLLQPPPPPPLLLLKAASSDAQDLCISATGRGALRPQYMRNSCADSSAALQKRYEEDTFIHIMTEGQVPHTRHVRGSNYAFISVFEDRLPGRAIVICGEHPAARLQLARSAVPPAMPALPAHASLIVLPHG